MLKRRKLAFSDPQVVDKFPLASLICLISKQGSDLFRKVQIHGVWKSFCALTAIRRSWEYTHVHNIYDMPAGFDACERYIVFVVLPGSESPAEEPRYRNSRSM